MFKTVVLIDVFASILIAAGLLMIFRQAAMRRVLSIHKLDDTNDEDTTTYVLRIAGTMLLAFGAALAILFTSFARLSS